ncbi:MAG: HDOD domain-containing protein [Opitutaceae bacterium]|nr:HDOD domain-containing protein [Opitutaceae bacterium]
MTPPTFDDVCALALRLPCAPQLLPRLSAALARDDRPSDELEAIIRIDPTLASSTLRLANSTYFASAEPIDRLSEAIFRLGRREIYRLAVLSLAGRWMNHTADGYRWEAGDFCRHALCRAIAAEHLAECSRQADPGQAYTAGLVCTVGKLAIAHACGAWFGAIRAFQQAQACPWTQAERSVLGYDYADAGTRLLQHWRFPPSLVAAATFQVRPAQAPDAMKPLLATLHAAHYLATAMGAGVTEDGFLFALDGDFLLAWGFTPELLNQALPVVLERARNVLQNRLTCGPVAF